MSKAKQLKPVKLPKPPSKLDHDTFEYARELALTVIAQWGRDVRARAVAAGKADNYVDAGAYQTGLDLVSGQFNDTETVAIDTLLHEVFRARGPF